MTVVTKGIMFIYLKIRVAFYKALSINSPVIKDSKIVQATVFNGKGSIELVGVSLGIYSSPEVISGSCYIEARHQGSEVRISNGTVINNNASIIAERSSISIGSNCLIGFNFQCIDSDFHPLSSKDRKENTHVCQDVYIGDNVFVGNNVTILKGVKVGNNSVIGTGSIVTKDVKENSVYAGNPAKFIRSLG
ncbi:acyltransferase [Vibrio vulnificus]|uniref:acyltransferase n=1 Tax=Vibrio vulnificus TaxID=672 RepID=UPI0032ECB4C5